MIVMLHRIAHQAHRWRVPLLPQLIYAFNRIAFGVVLPPGVVLGARVKLAYFGLGTVIHRRTVIGDDVVIGPNVTIGGRSGLEALPVIEDGAFLGAGARVLGPVRVGRNAVVGANAVVLRDVPPDSVVAGIPAKVIRTGIRPGEYR